MTLQKSLPTSFHRLAAANLAAQAAEQVSLAAVPMVAVLALGAGAGQIGALATAQTLPFLLLALPAGLLADRWSRRRIMVGSESLRALALFAMLLLTLLDSVSLPWLAVLGFIGAAGTVGFSVGAPALVPALVPKAALGVANTRLELARSLAFAAGPALAGALVAWAGASATFVLATLLSVAATVLLLQLQEPGTTQPAAPPRRMMEALRAGTSMVWGHELLRPVLLTAVVWNIAWFVLQAAYVPHAVRALGLSASAVGVTLACYGVGMVCGALVAPRMMKALPFGRTVMLGPFVSVVASLVMAATLLWPSGSLAALALFLFGAGPIVWTIASTTLRQTVTPQPMLGQVSAIFLTANAGARPLGAALGGLIGVQYGEGACLVVAALGFALQAALIAGSAMRGLKVLPAGV